MCEGKSDPVETWLTRLVAMALVWGWHTAAWEWSNTLCVKSASVCGYVRYSLVSFPDTTFSQEKWSGWIFVIMNVQNICSKPTQERYRFPSRDKIFTTEREVLIKIEITNFAISFNEYFFDMLNNTSSGCTSTLPHHPVTGFSVSRTLVF